MIKNKNKQKLFLRSAMNELNNVDTGIWGMFLSDTVI